MIIMETERLFLREMNGEDFDALYSVLADSDIMRHYPYTFDEMRVKNWIAKNIERYRVFGFGLWAVCLKDTGEMIGDCGLTMQNINGTVCPEIGYHIRRDCQRNGYAKEAAKAVRDWAFENTPFRVLFSYMKKENVASAATAKSVGMYKTDEYVDAEQELTEVYSLEKKNTVSRDENIKMSVDKMIETKRLKIYAASKEEMKAFIEKQTIDVLKEAYTEMLNGCLAHPDKLEWYAIWMIELKDGTHVGELCFKGLSEEGMTEIGYGIEEFYQCRGYATEAVSAIAEWALRQKGVRCIEAEAEESNAASVRVLEKCGFVRNGVIGEEGPRFVRS